MNYVLLTEFGSTIYGTRVATSDTDYKGIYIPSSRDICLQKIKKSINQSSKLDPNAKNTAQDTDTELFSLQEWFRLLLEGQTVALDMLFSPTKHHKETSDIWNYICKNKQKFFHKGVLSFVGYARTQANKYGIKGSRVKAMREMLDFLSLGLPLTKLHDLNMELLPKNEYTSIVLVKGPSSKEEPHIECCNRKVPFHATVKYATEIFKKIFDEYGARALMAEKNEGVDWKSLLHAVRVCNQAKEFLLTHHMTFPRPEAELLLKIRKAELPYKEVADMIENGIEELEVLKSKSTLPDSPDYKWVEDFVFRHYRKQVMDDFLQGV